MEAFEFGTNFARTDLVADSLVFVDKVVCFVDTAVGIEILEIDVAGIGLIVEIFAGNFAVVLDVGTDFVASVVVGGSDDVRGFANSYSL